MYPYGYPSERGFPSHATPRSQDDPFQRNSRGPARSEGRPNPQLHPQQQQLQQPHQQSHANLIDSNHPPSGSSTGVPEPGATASGNPSYPWPANYGNGNGTYNPTAYAQH